MADLFMVADHARNKGAQPDAVFAVAKQANAAIAQYGRDKVVDASIGAIYDDNEEFAYFSAVQDYLTQLPAAEMMNYAPIAGLPDFQQAAIEQTFQGYCPAKSFVKAVATPGGTGAVRNVFYNYLAEGQKALVPDWFWGNYRTIAQEGNRDIDTYKLFDAENRFNVESLQIKAKELLKIQDNLVIIFNSPAHNPTGYSMTEDDWVQVINVLKDCAENSRKKIIALIDIAYIDYAGQASETRKFFRLFEGLAQNILVTVAYSMSKSFLVYGMRSGAMIGLSSSQEIVEEMFRVNSASNRGIWSNGTRGAQCLLAEVSKNAKLREAIDKERKVLRDLMAGRAEIFMAEAQEARLETFPYHSGFFITIPAINPVEATKKLAQDNIYALALNKGLRVAISGIATQKIAGIAGKIKKAL